MYGQMEGAYYQLTQTGAARLQAGQIKHLDLASRQVLSEIARLGQSGLPVEWDELKTFGTYDSPTILSVALNRLIDLGYVMPITASPAGVQNA